MTDVHITRGREESESKQGLMDNLNVIFVSYCSLSTQIFRGFVTSNTI